MKFKTASFSTAVLLLHCVGIGIVFAAAQVQEEATEDGGRRGGGNNSNKVVIKRDVRGIGRHSDDSSTSGGKLLDENIAVLGVVDSGLTKNEGATSTTITKDGDIKIWKTSMSSSDKTSTSTANAEESTNRLLKKKFCQDEPGWTVPSDPNDCNPVLKPFVSMDCAALEMLVNPDGIENWCDFHKVNHKSNDRDTKKSAAEACCFCGGGAHIPEPCEDTPDWSLVGDGTDQSITCDFISKMVVNSTAFCSSIKDVKGSAGNTASDACCICGGGFRPRFGQHDESEEDYEEDNHDSTSKHKKNTSPSPQHNRRLNAQPPFEEDPPESPTTPDLRDWTTRAGLGESPGVPNAEYLGLGYDALRGNPRGSATAEIDPGFRSPVFELIQSQTVLSVDQEYTIPIGTNFKYTSSCRYDSKSREISSEADYRASLSSEANTNSQSSVFSSRFESGSFDSSSSFRENTFKKTDVKASVSFGFFSIGADYSTSKSTSFQREVNKSGSFSSARQNKQSIAFARSEKMDLFRSTSQSESSVSFEAKAICSEFELKFNNYAEKTLHPLFQKALTNLPVPYDKKNIDHKKAYFDFIATYGTHYTDNLVLGAKRILSTTMSSKSVAELTRDNIDIGENMSLDIQRAMAASKYEKVGIAVASSVSTSKSGGVSASYGAGPDGSVELANNSDQGDSPLVVIVNGTYTESSGAEGGGDKKGSSASLPKKKLAVSIGARSESRNSKSSSSSFNSESSSSGSDAASNNFDSFSRSRAESEAASKIASKDITTSEVTIGGLPKKDWREWAETVKAKPMPISYNLVGLWTLMTDAQGKAFYEAYIDIEDIDLKPLQNSNEILDAMHFGVSTGTGEPLSTYSVNPNSDFRTLLQVNNIPAAISPQTQVLDVLGESTMFESQPTRGVAIGNNELLCAISVETGNWNQNDLYGIGRLWFRYCGHDNWNRQSNWLLVVEPANSQGTVSDGVCSQDMYITGIRVRYCDETVKPELCTGDLKGIHGIDITCDYIDERRDTFTPTTVRVFCVGDDCVGDIGRNSTFMEWQNLPSSQDEDTVYGITGAAVLTGQCCEDRNDDNIGLVGLRLFYKEFLRQGNLGFTRDIVTYSTTWKGKGLNPNAIFATTIRGDIGRNREEENGSFGQPNFGIINPDSDNLLDFKNNVPFGISGDYSNAGVLTMSRFGTGVNEDIDLQDFSFLTANDFVSNHKDLVVGVIGDNGMVLNDRDGKKGVIDVEKEKKSLFRIELLGISDDGDGKNIPRNPVVILFPQWYTKGLSVFPTNLADISVAIQRDTNDDERTFHVRKSEKQLGVNFIAIDPSLENENIVFGTVEQVRFTGCNDVYNNDSSYARHCSRTEVIPTTRKGSSTTSSPNTRASKGKGSSKTTSPSSGEGTSTSPSPSQAPSKSQTPEAKWTAHMVDGYESDDLSDESQPGARVNDADICEEYPPSFRFNVDTFCNRGSFVYGRTGGIEIRFSKPFNALPSVIVTPILNSSDHCSDPDEQDVFRWNSEVISVPHCLVETLKKDSIYVKCGCYMSEPTRYEFSEDATNYFTSHFFYPVNFNFIAVGPVTNSETDPQCNA